MIVIDCLERAARAFARDLHVATDGLRSMGGPVDDFHVESFRDGAETTIVIIGEFDLSGTDLFWAHTNQALASRPRSIAIDTRGVTFIDSAGLVALWRARDSAHAAGVACRVTKPSPWLRRVAEMLGLHDLLLAE